MENRLFPGPSRMAGGPALPCDAFALEQDLVLLAPLPGCRVALAGGESGPLDPRTRAGSSDAALLFVAVLRAGIWRRCTFRYVVGVADDEACETRYGFGPTLAQSWARVGTPFLDGYYPCLAWTQLLASARRVRVGRHFVIS